MLHNNYVKKNNHLYIRKANKPGYYELWNSQTGELLGIDKIVYELIKKSEEKVKVSLLLKANKGFSENLIKQLIDDRVLIIK